MQARLENGRFAQTRAQTRQTSRYDLSHNPMEICLQWRNVGFIPTEIEVNGIILKLRPMFFSRGDARNENLKQQVSLAESFTKRKTF